jgi:pimeloyl-ACP methyl ester carboxylesterase
MIKLKAWVIYVLLYWTIGPLLAQNQTVEVDSISYAIQTNFTGDQAPGQPVLVFENGWGADQGNWAPLLAALEDRYLYFTYDRAGVGDSQDDGQEPTPLYVSQRLRALLQKVGLAPPYVLVGHSLGGVYVRAYAGYFPEEVAGLVFVDPADITETKQDWKLPYRRAGMPEARIESLLQERLYDYPFDPEMPPALWREREGLRELKRIDFLVLRELPLNRIPILFFLGGRFDVPPKYRSKEIDQAALFGFRKESWLKRWSQYVDKYSSDGQLVYVAKAGHFVHRDAPNIVAWNLSSLMERLD